MAQEAITNSYQRKKQIDNVGFQPNTMISSSGTRSTKTAQDNAKQNRHYIPPSAGIGVIKNGRGVKQGTEP